MGGREDLGVDPLRQPREGVAPRSPESATEIDGSNNGESGVEDDVPEIGVEEEESQLRHKHATKHKQRLVLAKNLANVLSTNTIVILNKPQLSGRVLQRENHEEEGILMKMFVN